MNKVYDVFMKTKDETEVKNWRKIKNEYCTTDASMRSLSRKYNVPVATISTRARREGWDKIVEQIEQVAEQKTIEKVAEKRASNNEKAMVIVNTLLDKIGEAVDKANPRDTASIKSLVGSMKELKDLGVYEVVKADAEIIAFQ